MRKLTPEEDKFLARINTEVSANLAIWVRNEFDKGSTLPQIKQALRNASLVIEPPHDPEASS